MEKIVVWFKDISKDDIAIVGGKGANLGEMTSLNLPIPQGFCTTSFAFRDALKQTGLDQKVYELLKGLDVEDTQRLQEVSAQIQTMISTMEMPDYIEKAVKEAYEKMKKPSLSIFSTDDVYPWVAVRSSATAEDLPSISETEHILIKINGNPFYKRMKDVYSMVGDGKAATLEIPAMVGNNIKWKNASEIYRHWVNGDKLYKIRTKTGKEVTISPNHTLIILDEETLTPKITQISELKGGEKIPTTSKIPLIRKNIKYLNVLDYVSGKDVILEKNLVKIKNKGTNWKIQNGLPKKILVNKDLLYFLGIYAAEGSTYGKNEVTVTNYNKNIINRVKKFLKSNGLPTNREMNKGSLRISCKPLVRLMHELEGNPLPIKGKGRSCKIKEVPAFVFGLKKELIGEFLRGCFDGDGYVGKNTIEFTSTSELLAGGIIKLLEMLDFRVYIRRKQNAITVGLSLPDAEKYRNLIGFEHNEKQKRLNSLIKNYNSSSRHYDFTNTIKMNPALKKKIREEIEKNLPREKVEIYLCPECNKEIGKTSKYKGKNRYLCKNCKKTYYEEKIN
ncbi:MAG: hypothetical protein JXA43_01705, partial [Candidatus Diapherotrites archaeon]|nr:hypothetical protein [Candidatus Diapherotrites archaeon]